MQQADVPTARDLLESGAFLLDVREHQEWDAGHAPEATHVPMGELTVRVGEVPTDRTIVVVCRSGARSGRVTQWLGEQGVDAHNLAGGMQAWAAAGHDVVTPAGEPGVVA